MERKGKEEMQTLDSIPSNSSILPKGEEWGPEIGISFLQSPLKSMVDLGHWVQSLNV